MKRNLPRLINNLSRGDTDKRRAAAEALAGADERAIYPLIKALGDSHAGVQDAAMRSLMAIGGPTTAYMVLPLLRLDSYLRNTALIILETIGPDILPLLRPLLTDKDDDVRKFALDLIIQLGQCDYPLELVRLLKEDPNANVRASTARALGVLAHREAIPALMEALADEEWVAFSALEALTVFPEERVIGSIASLLIQDSEIIREAAIEALGKIDHPAAVETLSQHLARAEGMEKSAVVKSLLRRGITPRFPGAADLISEIFQESPWDERLIALKGLVDLGCRDRLALIVDVTGSLDHAIPEQAEMIASVRNQLAELECSEELIAILEDPETRFKAKTLAIEVLQQMGCRAAIPHLVKLCESNIRDIKRASLQGLKDMNGSPSEKLFLDALEDADGHIRKTAVSALGKMGDPSVVLTLLELLAHEKYEDVSEEIVKALLIIAPDYIFSQLPQFDDRTRESIARNTTNISLLEALIGDEILAIRHTALAMLGTIDDGRVIPTLRRALSDPEAEMRLTALDALTERALTLEDILPLLNDSDLWVKVNALRTLATLENPATVPLLAAKLNAPEIPLVLTAIDGLARAASGNKSVLRSLLAPLLNHKIVDIRNRVRVVMDTLC